MRELTALQHKILEVLANNPWVDELHLLREIQNYYVMGAPASSAIMADLDELVRFGYAIKSNRMAAEYGPQEGGLYDVWMLADPQSIVKARMKSNG
ncbi:MAG: hypothetical protein R3213_06960 [Flavobacteriaceae bacterium]|nr:hypothetical protein [Flavobacteriaceae bacterium]